MKLKYLYKRLPRCFLIRYNGTIEKLSFLSCSQRNGETSISPNEELMRNYKYFHFPAISYYTKIEFKTVLQNFNNSSKPIFPENFAFRVVVAANERLIAECRLANYFHLITLSFEIPFQDSALSLGPSRRLAAVSQIRFLASSLLRTGTPSHDRAK